MCHHSNRQPNKQSHPAFLSNMIRYGADEGPGSMLAILSQGASSHVCVSVSNRPEWGFRGRWEWMRNVRKPKKGKEWRQKSKEVVYAHRTKMERGVFFIIGLFLRVPDSLAERRRQGDRDVYEVSLSLSPTHTHIHTHTHTHTHRPQRWSRLRRTPGTHYESLGPRWCGNLDKPSPSNYCRHCSFTGRAHYTKTKHTHNHSQSTTHSQELNKNFWHHTHTHTQTHTHTALYSSTCEHQSRLAPGPEALCG